MRMKSRVLIPFTAGLLGGMFGFFLIYLMTNGIEANAKSNANEVVVAKKFVLVNKEGSPVLVLSNFFDGFRLADTMGNLMLNSSKKSFGSSFGNGKSGVIMNCSEKGARINILNGEKDNKTYSNIEIDCSDDSASVYVTGKHPSISIQDDGLKEEGVVLGSRLTTNKSGKKAYSGAAHVSIHKRFKNIIWQRP